MKDEPNNDENAPKEPATPAEAPAQAAPDQEPDLKVAAPEFRYLTEGSDPDKPKPKGGS